MNIYKSIIIVIAVIVIMTTTISAQFWYGVDGPVPLKIDSLKVIIKFESGMSINQQQELLESYDRIIEEIDDEYLIDGFMACSLTTGDNYEAFLDSLKTSSAVELVEPYYLTENNFPQIVGNGFCVAFEDDITLDEIDSIISVYNVVIERELIGMPNIFVLNNTKASEYYLVELSNIFHNLPQTRYAHPDFKAIIETHNYKLYDYYNDYQPHTKKIIGEFNSSSVWDFYGIDSPVTVAVIDVGVTDHEDLPIGRILNGYDVAGENGHDYDPTPGPTEYHGMSCAGIIAASHTTDSMESGLTTGGIISVYPNVNVMPIKIFRDNGSASGIGFSDLTDAINYARVNGVDILSNSWGYLNPEQEDDPTFNQALDMAASFGRSGLGCPVIFSSGNTHPYYPDPSIVRYPARLDFCFAVGAVELDDDRWGYSCYGNELDIVAPSDDGNTVGLWSLDQMGALGGNSGDCPPGANDIDYICHFGGTSAACPLVAGTAALILAKEPNLTTLGVYNILKYSAQRDLDWGPLPDTPSVEYGYGRVDAFRAVLSISRNGDIAEPKDGILLINDIVWAVNYLFKDGSAPFPSPLLADVNCDGDVVVSDIVYMVDYLFRGESAPITPCFEF